ncbi:MAG: hypothetical protein JEZ07_13435 [Phycisphaerae bacterium]|nr:hypothetical protein [Phycisphaerae bacterium]
MLTDDDVAKGIALLILFTILFVVIYGLAWGVSFIPCESRDVYLATQEHIEATLVHPSTANYGLFQFHFNSVDEEDHGGYKVDIWVKAKTQYGVEIRLEAMAHVQKSNEEWVVTEFSIEEKLHKHIEHILGD